MSLIVNLLNGEEEVPLEIFPDESFSRVLDRAREIMGYEIDIKSLIGEDEVSPTDNVYDYFMRDEILSQANAEDAEKALADEENQAGESALDASTNEVDDDQNMIKIIELTGDYPEEELNAAIKMETPFNKENYLYMLENSIDPNVDMQTLNDSIEYYEEEEIDDSEIIEYKVRNRVTCHFCNIKLATMKEPRRSYIFEEKNNLTFMKNLMNSTTMNAKLICSKCLHKSYERIKCIEKKLSKLEFIVVSESIKMYYRQVQHSQNRRKSKITVRNDGTELGTEEGIFFQIINDKDGQGGKSTNKSKTDMVVRRKVTKDPPEKIIKRKLEMDGTISEVFADESDDRTKKQKIEHTLICRSCGLQLHDLTEVVQHSSAHQVSNRVNGIPCVICLRNFRSTLFLKRHVFSEHKADEVQEQEVIQDDYLDENDGSFVKKEVVKKKEEYHDDNDGEDYLTDRLQKYLTGEIDADTFFQQEKNDSNKNITIVNDILDDDDDVIVCIVAENEEDGDKPSVAEETAMNEVVQSEEHAETTENNLSGGEVQGLDMIQLAGMAIENADADENIHNSTIEDFQEVDYFEDPEYMPENENDHEDEEEEEDDDNDSVKSSDEKAKAKRKPFNQGKYKCNTCNKSYTSQLRLDQHKCSTVPTTPEDKKDLTCTICNETFLSKVRLQFHRQTHKEGGWQQMGCNRCPRKDFASEHELFDHVCFTHMKPFHCPYDSCGKMFKLRKLLKIHMKDHGMKKFGCHICGLRFQIHQTLKEHMVLHMKVKPYQCHICQKYMSKASRLRMHMLVHTSQQRPAHVLVCRLCDGAFKDVQEAEAHCDNLHECEPKVDHKDALLNEMTFDEIDFYNVDELKPLWRRADNDLELEDENGEIMTRKQSLLVQLSDVARNTIMPVWIDKVFSCQYCEKVYYTKEALHQHRVIHDGAIYPYQCHLCEAKFLTYARCTAHKSTHGYFKEGGAPSLRDFPVIKQYLCDICDKSNLLWTTVSAHYRHHHKHNSSRRSPPPCKTCHLQFSVSWDLGKHRRIKHRKEVHESAKAPNKTVNFLYKCTECSTELPTKAALTAHRKVAHNEEDGDKKLVKPATVLVCSECGKTYATKPALLTHIKWHTEHGIGKEAARRRKRAFGKGSHICSTCGLGFYSAANLRAHIDRIHEKSYKFTCEECGKGHFTHMEMETHKLTHTGERPFKCPDCPRAYVTKAILNKHYRNHTGERPYSCDICSTTFKTAHSRNYHKMKHENGKLPAPFVVLEVKGGNHKQLQEVISNSFHQHMHRPELKEYIKEEAEEYHPVVNEEEVLVRTSEVEEMDENIIPVQEETQDGMQIVYKKILREAENTCENEYTIEYEERE